MGANVTTSNLNRRQFLKGAAIGSATIGVPFAAAAAVDDKKRFEENVVEPSAYLFLNLGEQAFIEAVVDHMVPADQWSPNGTQMGIANFIDRSLASGWGKGERLYMQGPWKKGLPTQGYQLPLTPSQVYRTGITASNEYCMKQYQQHFAQLKANQKEEFLKGIQAGKITFSEALPSKTFYALLYDNVVEGMFSDPVYGGNRNKAGWKILGFPGAIATNGRNVEIYFDKPFHAPVFSIGDLA